MKEFRSVLKRDFLYVAVYAVVAVLIMTQLENWRCEGNLQRQPDTNGFAYCLVSSFHAYLVSVVLRY